MEPGSGASLSPVIMQRQQDFSNRPVHTHSRYDPRGEMQAKVRLLAGWFDSYFLAQVVLKLKYSHSEKLMCNNRKYGVSPEILTRFSRNIPV